jgi:hypothetical protein
MTADSCCSAKRRSVALIACVALLFVGACTTTTSGTGSLVTASDHSSPTAASTTTDTRLVPYNGDRFTVAMPGTPVKTVQQVPSAVGQIKFTILVVEKSDTDAFAVGYSDYPAGTQFDLNNAARGAAIFIHGHETDLHHVTYRSRPALDFRVIKAAGAQATAFMRTVLVDNRTYELFATVDGADVKTAPAEYLLMRDSLTF